MAQSLASTGTSAHIFAHPNLFAPPVVQSRLLGRHPKDIASLRDARYQHRKAAWTAQATADEIDSRRKTIAAFECSLADQRAKLATLLQTTPTTVRTGASHV